MSFFDSGGGGGGGATAVGGGDIWTTGAFSFESPLKDLLDSGTFSVEDLLAEDELLQELRGLHPQLVEFFSTESAVEGLVRYVVQEHKGLDEMVAQEVDDAADAAAAGEEDDDEFEFAAGSDPGAVVGTVTVTGTGTGTGTGEAAMEDATPTAEDAAARNTTGSKNADAAEKDGGAPFALPSSSSSEPSPPLPPPLPPPRSHPRPRHRHRHRRLVQRHFTQEERDRHDLRYVRYPYMACEVVCCEVEGVLDALVTGTVSEEEVLEVEEEQQEHQLREKEGSTRPPAPAMEMERSGREGEEKVFQYLKNDDSDVDNNDHNDGRTGGVGNDDDDDTVPARRSQSITLEQLLEDRLSSQKKAPHRSMLDLLFSILTDAPPLTLDDRRAGYLEKILSVLFRRRPHAMTTYLGGDGIPGGRARKHDGQLGGGDGGNDDDGRSVRIMSALFRQLHSHSVMQIAQRLLMPPPPGYVAARRESMLRAAAAAASAATTNTAAAERENNQDGSFDESQGRGRWSNTMMGGEGGNDDHIHHHHHRFGSGHNMDRDMDNGDSVLEEEDDPTGMGGMLAVRAEWSERPEAVELLLSYLLGEASDDIDDGSDAWCAWGPSGGGGGGGAGEELAVGGSREASERPAKRPRGDSRGGTAHPKGGFDDNGGGGGGSGSGSGGSGSGGGDFVGSDWEREEARLDASRHASDVLVSVVQNSPLDSSVLRALTSHPILGRIVRAIRAAALATGDGADDEDEGAGDEEEGEEEEEGKVKGMNREDFGPHESRATTAMSVLESLVLQLGGYGAVGGGNGGGHGEEYGVAMEEGAMQGYGEAREGEDRPGSADASALVSHLPPLLRSLSALLVHPSALNWSSSVQYSSKPALLLGASRLRVVRLLESLVLLGDPRVDSLLARSDALSHCLDLFWSFPWCSMLHQSVANLLVHVLEGGDGRGELQEYFLCRCDLVGRLMDSFGVDKGTGRKSGTSSPAPEPEGGCSGDVIIVGGRHESTGEGAAVGGGEGGAAARLDAAAAELASDLKAIGGVNNVAAVDVTPDSATSEVVVCPPPQPSVQVDKTGPRYSEMMFALKTYRSGQSATSSVESERGSSVASSPSTSDEEDEDEEQERRRQKDLEGEAIPISDDDVEAAMEKERQESAAEDEEGGEMLAMTAEEDAEGMGDNDDVAAVTPEAEAPPEEDCASSDDFMVDATFVKDGEAVGGNADPQSASSMDDAKEEEKPSAPHEDDDDDGPPFRMGYMGHVIIICQALVHACIATDEDGAGEAGLDHHKGGEVSREPSDARSKDSFDAEVELAVLPHLNGEGSADAAADGPPLKGNDEPEDNCGRDDEEEEAEGEESAESRKRKVRPSPEADDVKREGKKNLSVEEAGDALARTSLDPTPLSLEKEAEAAASSSAPTPTPTPTPTQQVSLPPPPLDSRPRIVRLMQNHPLYSRWQTFVTTTLASETAVQSTPLGGYASAHGQEDGFVAGQGMGGDMQQSRGMGEGGGYLGEEGAVLAGDEGDGMGSAADSAGIGIVGGVGGILGFVGPAATGTAPVVAGSIDLDDADLDIAASMMEALSLPPSGAAKEDGASGHGGHGGHVRGHHRIIGGGGGGGNVASFGSVVQMPRDGGAQYVYDDPLGGRNRGFDDEGEDASEGEDGAASGMSIGEETAEHCEREGKGDAGGSEDADLEEDKDDDDVPVIDLFAGNFSFQDGSAGGDGAVESKSAEEEDDAVNSDEAGWANFANFDDAFAASDMPEPTPMAPTSTSGESSMDSKDAHATSVPGDEADADDLFGDTPHLVDALANDDLENDTSLTSGSGEGGESIQRDNFS